MPYIGNSLATQFQAFATQTITGDGSTGYTLDRGVVNGKELLVYINNVKQEEGSGKSYTASGTTITFSEAVASTDSCYLVYLGSAVQTVTPPDASVSSSKLTSGFPSASLDMNGTELILDADGDTSITADTDDRIDIKVAGSDRVHVDSDGNLGLGISTPTTMLDIVSPTKVRSAIRGADSTSNSASKTFGILNRHYNTSEEDFVVIQSVSGSSSNVVDIGGGDLIGTHNACTTLRLFTASNQTTTGGTARLSINSSGAVTVSGSLSKGSGSFKIDHPLESKKDTHHLVHSFIEGPQADLIYRGKATLSSGTATVNIDTVSGMTSGTFVALNTNVQCFTNNESGWTAVKGSVSGNTLTITAQDNSCTDTISWMVIGERQDPHMKDSETDWTDSDGKVILEPKKESK